MIAFSRVTKRYGKTVALSDVTFTVHPKECVCITGPVKAGKSTILRLLLRAESPSQGSVSIDNVDLQLLPPTVLRLYRQRMGLKLAEGNLFLQKTVTENLTFSLLLRGMEEREALRMARAMLERLSLLHSADSVPTDLTAEGQTLLGLGRVLISNPLILLLDEPFTDLSLDAFHLAVSLLIEAHRSGTTILCFSRDESCALALGARHIRIATGTIVDDTPPEGEDATPPLSSTIHNILARVLLPRRNQPTKEKKGQKVEVVAG